jgi:Collagen triple helix repeat (20 copies)
MFSPIRRRLSYANVVATLALVFAMSGGALAATHYLVTSTKQISPKVLKSLKGAKGTNGINGVAGAAGSQGPQGGAGPAGPTGPAGSQGVKGETGATGPEGSPWTVKGMLPSKASEHGAWGFRGTGGSEGKQLIPISFPIPLAEQLEEEKVIVVPEGTAGGRMRKR